MTGRHVTSEEAVTWLRTVRDEPYAYLTTTGRRTGRPHEIEIWFAVDATTVYLLAERRDDADWVRNLQRHPEVSVRIARRTVTGVGRVVATSSAEDARARTLVWTKYATSDDDLTHWRDHALTVAVDVTA